MTDEMQAKRDELAKKYSEEECYAMEGIIPHRDTYQAGFDACYELMNDHRAVQAVMDLYFALKEINAQPTRRDLVKLAKRIRGKK